jgi:serine/threonine-protein phosphatase PGAM5
VAVRTLYVIRHGQYKRGPDPLDDFGLTDIGYQQALITAQALKDLPIKAIYTSTLLRAVETTGVIAGCFAPNLIRTFDDLCETVPFIPQKHAAYFAEKMPHLTPELVARARSIVDGAYARLFVPPTDTQDVEEIIVAHGNIIQYFVTRVLDAPADLWTNMDTYNCGITRVKISSTNINKLISFNDFGHLPPELRTIL